MPPEGQKMNSAEALVLDERTRHMQSDVQAIAGAVQDVNRKLELLPVMAATVEHLRTDLTKTTRDHEERIQRIEQQLPGLAELRKWVVGGIIAALGMMGAAIIKLVIVDPVRQTAAIVQPQPSVKP
jgi:C4-dicarboxylate-specific signal transduction histidine kinase